MSFDQIAWLPLCAGVTAVGIALSYLAFRRRGMSAGMRTLAWALLPLAAYLTGVVRTLWNIGSSLVSFVTGLVLSPAVWAGIVIGGVSVLLFFASGVMRGRALSRSRGGEPGKPAKAPAAVSDGAGQKTVEKAKPAASDDFADIEDILKRRGIN
ncbi:cellulose synthase [Streptosporangiaceae bacterium NEAU-GS5]|nr:cellulose synthase [Streptosporangiaceae bacterium NEAU-GS5]